MKQKSMCRVEQGMEDDFKQGDKVRLVTSRNALGDDFNGPSRQHGKQIGTVLRVYEEMGDAVCDIEFSDGSTQTGVACSSIEPAAANLV